MATPVITILIKSQQSCLGPFLFPSITEMFGSKLFQGAVRRRDSLQLDKERAADERLKRKKTHDEVSASWKQLVLSTEKRNNWTVISIAQ